MTWAKYAVMFAKSKTGRKIIAGITIAVLSPFILLIVCICALLGGGAENNAMVVDHILQDTALPAEVSAESKL